MQEIELKQGGRYPKVVVNMVMSALFQLWNPDTEDLTDDRARLQGMLAVADLYRKCRGEREVKEGTSMTLLTECNLLNNDGSVDTAIQQIVLSAVVYRGDIQDVYLMSPVKGNDPSCDSVAGGRLSP